MLGLAVTRHVVVFFNASFWGQNGASKPLKWRDISVALCKNWTWFCPTPLFLVTPVLMMHIESDRMRDLMARHGLGFLYRCDLNGSCLSAYRAT